MSFFYRRGHLWRPNFQHQLELTNSFGRNFALENLQVETNLVKKIVNNCCGLVGNSNIAYRVQRDYALLEQELLSSWLACQLYSQNHPWRCTFAYVSEKSMMLSVIRQSPCILVTLFVFGSCCISTNEPVAEGTLWSGFGPFPSYLSTFLPFSNETAPTTTSAHDNAYSNVAIACDRESAWSLVQWNENTMGADAD